MMRLMMMMMIWQVLLWWFGSESVEINCHFFFCVAFDDPCNATMASEVVPMLAGFKTGN